MKILHRYILSQLLRNLLLSLMIFSLLFLVFDFFDRIDNIMREGAGLWTVISYFLYKVPLTISLMMPVAILVSVLFTVGILSKNSEITAMRASGLKIFWLARPILLTGILLSIATLIFNETLVPYSARRVREIYNIDIRQKTQKGGYNQKNFWWRNSDTFYSVASFDSRSNTLHDLSIIDLKKDSRVSSRTIATEANWLKDTLGWNMRNVTRYRFPPEGQTSVTKLKALPLPIEEKPRDFYNARVHPHTMSYIQLQNFIDKQKSNGLSITSYLADLYAKLSFPFVIFILSFAALPFALLPARSGSMAMSFIIGLLIAFSYHAVHSFSISMGRAEFWHPALAAWMANLLLGLVGLVLNMGAESP